MQNRRPVIHCPDTKISRHKEYNGVYGPQHPGPSDSYIGSNLLHKDENRAIVRGGGIYHTGRMMLFVFFAIFVMGGGGVIYRDYERYLKMPNSLKMERSFIHVEFDLIEFRFEKYRDGRDDLLDLLSKNINYLFFFPALTFCLIIVLWPMSAPLCFDRRRRLVYTISGKKIWLADFDAMPTVIHSSIEGKPSDHLRTSNLMILYKHDGKSWKPDFRFSIASHRYFREPLVRDNYGDRSWRWMIDYMDKGPEAVHDRIDKIGILNLLTPFTRKLPDDIEARVDRLIEEAGGAPGDTNLPPRPPPDPLGAFLGQFPNR